MRHNIFIFALQGTFFTGFERYSGKIFLLAEFDLPSLLLSRTIKISKR